ncbi:hypothetical protein ACHAXT_006437 [Thalassiosira profunda]
MAPLLLLLAAGLASAYTTPGPRRALSRKAFIHSGAAAAVLQSVIPVHPAGAFDGAGSSAYAGKSTTSKADLQKSYKSRVVADVRDFRRLGMAIQNGDTNGPGWVNFFIEFQRREPDAVGRTYAAYVDLVGNKELSGCGTLLAASFAKPGKAVGGAAERERSTLLEPIKVAGQKGDLGKAKAAYGKVTILTKIPN